MLRNRLLTHIFISAKDYLERTIIISKGSVERAKKKLDSICTYRTLFPEYFTVFNVQENELLDEL